MGEVRGPTIFYGLCRGGPFTLRHMAHHELDHVIWSDVDTKRAIPGMIGPSAKYPGATVGRYRFDTARKEWDWQEGD